MLLWEVRKWTTSSILPIPGRTPSSVRNPLRGRRPFSPAFGRKTEGCKMKSIKNKECQKRSEKTMKKYSVVLVLLMLSGVCAARTAHAAPDFIGSFEQGDCSVIA